MRTRWFVLGMTCVCAARAALALSVLEEQTVRQAIEAFSQNPIATTNVAPMRTITGFAEKSDDVDVVISQRAISWPGTTRHGPVLLCAFIAGNVLSQLDSGVKGDDAYSGLIRVFRVYRAIKARERGYTVTEIENLLAIHKRGELARHVKPEGAMAPAR